MQIEIKGATRCFLSFFICLNFCTILCEVLLPKHLLKYKVNWLDEPIFRFIRLGELSTHYGELSTHYTCKVVSTCCRLCYSLSLGIEVVYITLNPSFNFLPFTELFLSSIIICFFFVLAICHPQVWSQLAR